MKSTKEVLIEDSIKKLETIVDSNLKSLQNKFSVEKEKLISPSGKNIVSFEEYSSAWEKFLKKYLSVGWKETRFYTQSEYDRDGDRVYSTGLIYFEISA